MSKICEGRFVVANQALAQLLGVASPDALIGKTDFELFPHELATAYDADERAIIASGVPLLNKEEPVQCMPMAQSTGSSTTKVPMRDDSRVERLAWWVAGRISPSAGGSKQSGSSCKKSSIQAQAATLQELSTPLIPISDTCW